MNDIKEDVKNIVKAYIQVFISILAKESTKKMIKNLEPVQKEKFEAKIRNMPDKQLAQYFDKNPYPEKIGMSKSISEAIDYVIKIPITPPAPVPPVPRKTLTAVAVVSVLIIATFFIMYPKPIANFTTNITNDNASLTVQFTDLSQHANKLNWSFGDGYYSTDKDPIHTYSAAGTYTVNLTATNARGTDSKNATIMVLQLMHPVANFSSNVTSGNSPLNVMFTDTSIGTPTEWNWDYGDGNFSTERNPAHTYSTEGNYTIILTVTNSAGSSTATKANYIEVKSPPNPTPPVVNFFASQTSGTKPLTVKFTDNSKNSPTAWNWSFGDGTYATIKNPTHTYSAAGSYTVTLTAGNEAGNGTKTISDYIKVTSPPRPPPYSLLIASFTSNVTSGKAPLNVAFTDTSIGKPTSWNWNFGDGTSSTVQNPTHTYATAGNYNVILTVLNSKGKDSTNAIINVLKKSELPAYAYIPNAGVDSTISIIDTANDTIIKTIVLSEIEQYWPYGVAANKAGTKVYVTNSYKNSVSVIDTVNNVITATVPVGNWPRGVAVTPDGSKVYVANTNSDTVSVIDTSNNNVIVTLNVGDRPYGVAVTPDGSKVYVTNEGSDTVSIINTVTNEVEYTINLESPMHRGSPRGITVTPDGTRVYLAYVVNFGYYDYDTVSVIDTSNNTVIATVNVGAYPEGIAINPTGTIVYVTNSIDNTVSVIDTTRNIVVATIPVGDMPQGVAVTPNGKKVYVGNINSGTVSVIDTANNTVTATVKVGNNPYAFGQFIVSIPEPIANFTSDVTEGYAPLTVSFTDLSENEVEWNWDFGDGTTSTEQSPVHTYIAAGNYTVNLTVGNLNGTDSKTASITVLQSIPSDSGKQFAYITNQGSDSVSVIDMDTKTVIATIPVGDGPSGAAVNPAGTKVYVTNSGSNTVSVINTASNTVASTVNVGNAPYGVAVSPDGQSVYVTNLNDNSVSVINTATNQVIDTVSVGRWPEGVAFTPDGEKVYVANYYSYSTISVINTTTNSVAALVNNSINGPSGIVIAPDGKKAYVTSNFNNKLVVIDTASNQVIATENVGSGPHGIAVSPDGTRVYVVNGNENTISIIDTVTGEVIDTVLSGNGPYGVSVSPDGKTVCVANRQSNNVSIINTATNTVIATIPVEISPASFGQFIGTIPAAVLPVANFSSNVTEGYAPLTVSFTDLSENATDWNWDFGDGTSSTVQNPTHTYNKNGEYAVILTVSNLSGTSSKTSIIECLSVVSVSLSSDPQSPFTLGETIFVTAKVYPALPGAYVELESELNGWFANGYTDTSGKFTGVYKIPDDAVERVKYTSNPGGFYLSALANGIQSMDYYCRVSEQPVLPVADFSASSITGKAPLTVTFADKSTGSPTSWYWDFGDKNSSSEQNPMHTYLVAGNYTVSLTVSNLNGKDSKTAAITVLQSIPEISWISPANITYGTALSATQLNAEASVAGNFTYIPAAGTVLDAGNGQKLHVDFAPFSPDYSTVSKEVTINVLKADPIITWNDPADITYGTLLTETQLNAKADAPGNLVYTPPEGTRLDIGTEQMLHVDFTPDSSIANNYNGASKEVKINVLKATPVIQPIFLTKWGSEGIEDGDFYFPEGIAVDSSGNVYVADTRNNRIQKFDSNGAFITKWGSYGGGDGEFHLPGSIAVDSSGNVYVADTYNNRIQKFDSNGTFITKWGSVGIEDGEFVYPMGIAVDSSGNVYVADTGDDDRANHRIQKFYSNGTFITKWGSEGIEDGEFVYPMGIAVDSSGNVYVADTYNNRIQKFDSNGAFITKWGSYGSGDGEFTQPEGIAVDSSGNVYVADTWNNRIQKFNSNGAFITKWGSKGSEDGEFGDPWDVAVDSSDNVYVDERSNFRVQKFVLEKITPTVIWNNPADITVGITLDPDQLNAIATDSNTGNSVLELLRQPRRK